MDQGDRARKRRLWLMDPHLKTSVGSHMDLDEYRDIVCVVKELPVDIDLLLGAFCSQ